MMVASGLATALAPMRCVRGGVLMVKAPGTFLRSFRWGHVRQLDRVSRELLARSWAGCGPGDGPLTQGFDTGPSRPDVRRPAVALCRGAAGNPNPQ